MILDRIPPVSYTHLDVYKRQVVGWGVICALIGGGVAAVRGSSSGGGLAAAWSWLGRGLMAARSGGVVGGGGHVVGMWWLSLIHISIPFP